MTVTALELRSDEYRAMLQSIQRVVVPQPHVRLAKMTEIARRVKQLRKIVSALDAELQVAFPLIVVRCVSWCRTDEDRRLIGMGHARVGPYDTGQGFTYVIELSAASLLEIDQASIELLLAHEFLHYVFDTIEAREQLQRSGELRAAVQDDFLGSRERYRQVDQSYAAEPEMWLSARLRTMIAMDNDGGRPSEEVTRAVEKNWIRAGLPWSEIDCGYQVGPGQLLLDSAIAAGSGPFSRP